MGDQEKKSSYDPDSGVSLKDAINHYSDPDLWFEYQTFSAPAVSLQALLPRARVLLKNESSKSRAVKKNRIWKKLRHRFEARLHSGELVVTGYMAPVPLDGKPDRIPQDKLRILTFDYNTSSASAPGLAITGIRVSSSKTTGKEKAEEWAKRLEPVKNKKGGYRAVAIEIAREVGLDHLTIEREVRRVRARKRESGGKKLSFPRR